MNEGESIRFFVGTYSQQGPYVPTANGEGVISCTLDLTSGEIEKESVCREAINSTYMAKDADGEYLFVACDMFASVGSVKVLSVDSHGFLELLSSQSSHGKSTCHIDCDSEGRMIFASSYLDGKVTAYRFDGDELSPAERVISYEGSGPNPNRQEKAHAHQALVSPNNRWLYVCDLGSDKIWIHDLPDLFGNSEEPRSIDVPAGYGPRHLVWNPAKEKVYVFCELNSHILVYDWNSKTGGMNLVADVPALPDEYEGDPAGAAIRLHPSGKALYVSDRGQNSIVALTIDESDGSLSYDSWFPIQGKTPRDFAIDPTGRWLLSANQDSDCIVPFLLNPDTGLPSGDTAPVFECGTPVSLLFL